jgi:hypothetical protein
MKANISKLFAFEITPKIETIAKLLDVFDLEIKVARKV